MPWHPHAGNPGRRPASILPDPPRLLRLRMRPIHPRRRNPGIAIVSPIPVAGSEHQVGPGLSLRRRRRCSRRGDGRTFHHRVGWPRWRCAGGQQGTRYPGQLRSHHEAIEILGAKTQTLGGWLNCRNRFRRLDTWLEILKLRLPSGQAGSLYAGLNKFLDMRWHQMKFR